MSWDQGTGLRCPGTLVPGIPSKVPSAGVSQKERNRDVCPHNWSGIKTTLIDEMFTSETNFSFELGWWSWAFGNHFCCHTHLHTSVSQRKTESVGLRYENRCTCVHVWVRRGTTGKFRVQKRHLCCRTYLDESETSSLMCTCVNEEGDDGWTVCSETPSLLSYTHRYVSFTEVGRVCRGGVTRTDGPVYIRERGGWGQGGSGGGWGLIKCTILNWFWTIESRKKKKILLPCPRRSPIQSVNNGNCRDWDFLFRGEWNQNSCLRLIIASSSTSSLLLVHEWIRDGTIVKYPKNWEQYKNRQVQQVTVVKRNCCK